MSSFFIFDPGILKRMGKVIDSKSVKKLEFEVIDEHMKRQNIGFFKQGFCVSISELIRRITIFGLRKRPLRLLAVVELQIWIL